MGSGDVWMSSEGTSEHLIPRLRTGEADSLLGLVGQTEAIGPFLEAEVDWAMPSHWSSPEQEPPKSLLLVIGVMT